MYLSARILNLVNVNSFEYANQAKFTQGDTLTVYFQLTDLNKNPDRNQYAMPGLRYAAASGSTLSVTIGNVDTAKVVTKTATQPFSSDLSIWSINILATDTLAGGMHDMRLALTESAVVTRGVVANAMAIQSQNGAFI